MSEPTFQRSSLFLVFAAGTSIASAMCDFNVSWHLLHDGQQSALGSNECVDGVSWGDTCQFLLGSGDTLRSSWAYGVGGGCTPWTFVLYHDEVEISTITDQGTWYLTEPGLYRCRIAGLGGVDAYWRITVQEPTAVPDVTAEVRTEGLEALYSLSSGASVQGQLALRAGGLFQLDLLDLTGRAVNHSTLRAAAGRTSFVLVGEALRPGVYVVIARDNRRRFSGVVLIH